MMGIDYDYLLASDDDFIKSEGCEHLQRLFSICMCLVVCLE